MDNNIDKTKEIPGNNEDQTINVDKTTDVAPEKDETTEDGKLTNTDSSEELPDSEDLSTLISFINEVDSSIGGVGGITDIPKPLIGVIKDIVQKLVSAVTVFEDPIMKDIIEDMMEQEEDGSKPDALLAIRRNVASEDLEGSEGDENYEALQGALNDRVASRQSETDNDDILLKNIDRSMEELEAYCSENGLDEDRKVKLWGTITKFRDAFADGVITKDEYSLFDKGGNYDADIEVLQAKVPDVVKKEVLPDSTSVSVANPVSQNKKNPLESTIGMGAPAYKKMNKGRK